MLIRTFIPLTTKSVTIGLTLSCMPMNHPLKAIRDKVAGAAHILMKKYFDASSRTSGVQSTTQNAALTNIHWMAMSTSANANDIPSARVRILAHSLSSFRPQACAVSPPVPTLRKPKFQYSRSKSMVPMAIPPIIVATSPVRCPATAISTIPTIGTVILANMLGMASFNISLLIDFMDLPVLSLFLEHAEIGRISVICDVTVLHSLLHGTARLVSMGAWSKTAII